MPKPDNESCGNCRFFQADDRLHATLGEDVGWCIRYPPRNNYMDQATYRQLSRFGTTMKDWWCGEHKDPFPAT